MKDKEKKKELKVKKVTFSQIPIEERRKNFFKILDVIFSEDGQPGEHEHLNNKS